MKLENGGRYKDGIDWIKSGWWKKGRWVKTKVLYNRGGKRERYKLGWYGSRQHVCT
jgi:hypothetical protein